MLAAGRQRVVKAFSALRKQPLVLPPLRSFVVIRFFATMHSMGVPHF
jgi:hypothetical protein